MTLGDFILWVSGGDGICELVWQVPSQSIAAGMQIKEQKCGGVATEPVTYYNEILQREEPHLICIHCLPKFLEKPGAARMYVVIEQGEAEETS
jgi:hypothetical protein